MYWTSTGNNRIIERASMDGTNRSILHSSLGSPYGLTVDYSSQNLYWIDSSLDVLETSSVDGNNRKILTRANVVCPYGLAYFNQSLYWGDTCHNVIYTTSVSSPNNVTVLVSTNSAPYRIRTIAEQMQPTNG